MSGLESEISALLAEAFSSNATPELLQKLQTLSQEMAQDAEHLSGNSWSHSVCHLFEQYARAHDLPSYLNDAAFFPAATILVDKAVELGPEKAGCLSRIIGPIIKYNLDAIAKGAVDEFAYKPESLSSPSLQEWPGLVSCFAKSQTPREFLKLLTDDPAANLAQDYDFNRITQALEQAEGTEALETLSAKLAAKLSRGAFVDVEGTLIDRKGAFNPTLGIYITYLLNKSIPVTVFTGGDTEALTEKLAKLGLERF